MGVVLPRELFIKQEDYQSNQAKLKPQMVKDLRGGDHKAFGELSKFIENASLTDIKQIYNEYLRKILDVSDDDVLKDTQNLVLNYKDALTQDNLGFSNYFPTRAYVDELPLKQNFLYQIVDKGINLAAKERKKEIAKYSRRDLKNLAEPVDGSRWRMDFAKV
ncbi:MAG: hypothetical protein HRT47_05300 [Candidatus Caenarcaniphilales bacterium]|nr:hypothetical protein [Candidatus Caenarcaniphilales bacterium]